MVRAFIGGLSFASVLFAPIWVPLIGAGALAIRFRAWEILVLGALVDLLYVPPEGIFGIPIPATIITFFLLMGFEPLRKKILV